MKLPALSAETKPFTVVDQDLTRPWGGFYVLAENQIEKFATTFFPPLASQIITQSSKGLKLTPKFLLVAPRQRLSWQYHHRRSELWRVVTGPIGISLSANDSLPDEPTVHHNGDIITIKQGTRHRLIGLDNWGLIAEIWQHTNPTQPSNEDDIIRLADDYGRDST